jgi:flagellar basal-body rod modification protein FlgD
MTDAISGTSNMLTIDEIVANSNTPADTKSTTKKSNEIDKDMFLKLLVTQLKYQDPMNPADPSEFLSQTAQFTSVEKLTQLAENSLQSALAMKMSTASSMIGRDVSYAGTGGLEATGMVQTAHINDSGDIVLSLQDGNEVNLTAVKSISQHIAR